ncbi:hypothetical protein ANCCAN_20228 [Ancylostoma caninum]|uniref:Arrestin-like N-terminal domain-containing protein n=1 Tax=Ancylostoma caninum TaxID=29170 RepID=A0A368FR18_ANCCA|nr:hypothetical protein ANCCAN_20228 [Ancylostoma caninum]
MVLAEGYHRLPMLLILPADLPGSFDGKYGAIAYRVVAKHGRSVGIFFHRSLLLTL